MIYSYHIEDTSCIDLSEFQNDKSLTEFCETFPKESVFIITDPKYRLVGFSKYHDVVLKACRGYNKLRKDWTI